jgi:hypothetical protein
MYTSGEGPVLSAGGGGSRGVVIGGSTTTSFFFEHPVKRIKNRKATQRKVLDLK